MPTSEPTRMATASEAAAAGDFWSNGDGSPDSQPRKRRGMRGGAAHHLVIVHGPPRLRAGCVRTKRGSSRGSKKLSHAKSHATKRSSSVPLARLPPVSAVPEPLLVTPQPPPPAPPTITKTVRIVLEREGDRVTSIVRSANLPHQRLTRKERAVKTISSLRRRVRRCTAMAHKWRLKYAARKKSSDVTIATLRQTLRRTRRANEKATVTANALNRKFLPRKDYDKLISKRAIRRREAHVRAELAGLMAVNKVRVLSPVLPASVT